MSYLTRLLLRVSRILIQIKRVTHDFRQSFHFSSRNTCLRTSSSGYRLINSWNHVCENCLAAWNLKLHQSGFTSATLADFQDQIHLIRSEMFINPLMFSSVKFIFGILDLRNQEHLYKLLVYLLLYLYLFQDSLPSVSR